jgi:hypothetical protein
MVYNHSISTRFLRLLLLSAQLSAQESELVASRAAAGADADAATAALEAEREGVEAEREALADTASTLEADREMMNAWEQKARADTQREAKVGLKQCLVTFKM